ncbi:MAG TPA: ribbon-helix-helix domain-containing protein [Bryobacteraceae bacterium]|nr:ribbon-helix-helix domain-containing protein [Bryobacteraceae bacterium]HZW94720.1 ribbon-helix-helix domain-containing protein [Candidatus Eremiobacteraceae bacterium]
MSSPKPLLNFYIDKELLDRVNEFWHEHRFPARAEAIRWLIQAALDKKLAPKAGVLKAYIEGGDNPAGSTARGPGSKKYGGKEKGR